MWWLVRSMVADYFAEEKGRGLLYLWSREGESPSCFAVQAEILTIVGYVWLAGGATQCRLQHFWKIAISGIWRTETLQTLVMDK